MGNLATFKAEYVGGRGLKAISTAVRNEKLRELLGPFMMMRRPGYHFLGSALVKLPETHPDTVKVEQSKEENVISEALEEDLKDHLMRKAENPKAKKNSRKAKRNSHRAGDDPRPCLYEAMMRARQFAASPLLLEKLVKEQIWTRAQVKSMKEKAHAMGCTETPFIDQFEKWLEPNSSCKPTSAKVKKASQLSDRYLCTRCGGRPQQRAEVCTLLPQSL